MVVLDPRFRGGDERGTSSRRFRIAGLKAFAEAGITHSDADHLMIYDAFAHLPIYGLEDLGFVPRGEAGAFIAERTTAPGVPGTARRPTGQSPWAEGPRPPADRS